MANAQELSQFEQIITGLLSPDNNVRGKCEKMFEQTKQQPDLLLRVLTQLFLSSQKLSVRQFVSVMIRQNIQKEQVWDQVSVQTREFLKQTLLGLLKTEHAKEIRQKTSDLIGVLSAKCFSSTSSQSTGWSELFPTLFEVAQSSHSLHRISVYNVLEVVAEFNMETMRPHLQPVKQILCLGLKDSQRSTQLHALKAMVALLIEITPEEREQVTPEVVGLLFQIVMNAFQANDDDSVCESVKILVELARCEPTFLRHALVEVVGAMVQIAGAGRLDNSARQMAFEFLLTLSETGKGMTRKLSSYSDEVIKLAFQFMIEIKTSLEEWSSVDSADDLDEENFVFGREAISRLSSSLGAPLFLPRTIPIIQQYLSSTDWTHRHAALIALGHMGEGCKKELKDQLEQIVSLTLPHTNDAQNPRVQWAAVDALAHFADNFSPTFQKKFHQQVLQALLICMNSSHARVVAHGALCLVDFCRGIHSEAPESIDSTLASNLMAAHADSILHTLQKIIQMNNLKVQEATIAAIASVAAVCEKKFIKYYKHFMEGVKNILSMANGKHQRQLRGRAVECIALIAKAVGRERFQPDFKSVMDFLISSQKAGFANDDPQNNYVVSACVRICQCVGEAFIPYLSFVVPPLLKSVSINNAFQITDACGKNPDEGKDGFQSMTVSIRRAEEKRVTINTSLMQEQATACQMLYQYANILKDGFFPYVDSTIKALVPVAHCPFNETVRLAATAALPALLTCAKMHFKKQGTDGNGYINQIWDYMFPALIHAIEIEFHIDNLIDRLHVFGDCLDIVESPLSPEQVRVTNVLMSVIVKDSIKRRKALEECRKDVDFDEQENAKLEEEHDEENYLLSNINTCILNLAKNSRESYVDSFHELLYPLFFPMLELNRRPGEQMIGLCVMDSIVQYGGGKAHQYLEKYLPITKHYAMSKDVDIRQAAVFGIGVCAESLGEKFTLVGEEFLEILLKIITATGSRNEENGRATDNAISALGRICRSCYNHPPVVQGKNLLELWLRMLPIKDDEEEVSAVTEVLCDFVDRQNPYVLGENNNNLPKIVSVFAQTLISMSAEENTKKRIKTILNRLQNSLSQEKMQQVMSLVNQEQQNQMQIILSGIYC